MAKSTKNKKQDPELTRMRAEFEVGQKMRKLAEPGNQAQMTRLLAMQKPKAQKK